MKTILQNAIMLILLTAGIHAFSQPYGNEGTPYKPTESSVYGPDILIQVNSSEDQRYAKMAIAKNGTIYAAYIISSGGLRIASSTDNGTTWTYSATLRAAFYVTAMDIAVTGADNATTGVWIISSGFYKASIDMWDVSVEKLDYQMTLLSSTSLDQMISNYGFPDVAIATDYDFPSAGASPFSIGVLYSKIGMGGDNVIFKSSGDGGSTFTNTQILAATGHYLINVALGFGRSPSYAGGTYFASWDKQPFFSYYSSYFGEIYAAHSISQFDGAWSVPYRLDTIGGGIANGAKDPSIACQADIVNNGSNAFSVTVVYEKRLTATGSNTCAFGVGNLNPVSGDQWSAVFSTGAGLRSDIEPYVTYTPSDQKFYVTWSDSLNAKLKCSVSDANFATGGSWTSYSSGYNDSPSISNPFPKVKVSTASHQVMNIWDGNAASGIANATFDRSDLPVTLAGTLPSKQLSFTVSPNPCRNHANLNFSLGQEENVSVSMFDLSGRMVFEVPSRTFTSGDHTIGMNTDQMAPDCYLVRIIAGNESGFRRLVVIP
jgi:hypothetical protein